ncbi:MAG: FAD-dependent oxidoreductase [Sphingobacteriales bacterium 17-39-43]|uniref:NAD(P)/FAD-dependent oxidoreductase n=1 Tax=Daejeonella sp. TaxID=2805397 RepID=UPI000BD204C9|nr:FAD-dependent oxidoreductase [Daejeonella sp.]OYZ32018.1 MAG: FAD-dependent oxidoreductase [Sphingobacteriales bacterium 16-39-50]OZA25322.1 MAG: FAD-dependent oxidoreductase [Sphingobacteriales bacterium 17-39-43]OZA59622.1 MAG: FAD-dependent oxidoreductase [Sphingobacteriales bacterium 39-40-5]HQS50755.1 FAD-dependent oxidoreductase [Daejeonella sp.]HQT22566.1 FAD-dependent oxidoreductase [Daejeonella sp.]
MNIVIIGNGITGITCARNVRKLDSNASITVISGETEHFFSRTALMYIYMGHMKFEHTKPYEDWFWKKNRINLIKAYVKSLNSKDKTLHFDNGESIAYDKLIIACGSVPNKFGWPGENLHGVQGLYSIQDLEQMERNTKNISSAVIIGGGLIGIEMAEMLHSRKIEVKMLVRENFYWGNILPREEAQLIGKHISAHGIDLQLNTELKEIISDDQNRVKGVLTNKGEQFECQFVGLTAGVKPNIGFLEKHELETERGILINEYFETSIPHIYAAGDCAQFRNPKPGEPAIEQLWYTGKMQAETLARTICGDKSAYNRGIWFNSAKFFDLEYQTYGQILPEINDQQKSFYWEHPNGKHAFRANYSSKDESISGFNFIGIRFRQIIAEEWIREHKTIGFVIQNLKKGWFDPEFSKAFYNDISHSYLQSLKSGNEE